MKQISKSLVNYPLIAFFIIGELNTSHKPNVQVWKALKDWNPRLSPPILCLLYQYNSKYCEPLKSFLFPTSVATAL